MFLVLFLHFRSVNLALQMLLSIPMAFIGAVAYVAPQRTRPSRVATLVGLIALGGIATRNAILLVDHYLHLMREEGKPFGRGHDRAGRPGADRAGPDDGADQRHRPDPPRARRRASPGASSSTPWPRVIVGGLVSSTLLDVLLTPGLFWLFGRRAAEAQPRPAPKTPRPPVSPAGWFPTPFRRSLDEHVCPSPRPRLLLRLPLRRLRRGDSGDTPPRPTRTRVTITDTPCEGPHGGAIVEVR